MKPPADPENPRWENLSSNVGAQYFWWDRVFDWSGDQRPASFLYQALHTSLPGTLDTSLVSTDNINNPRTMNAVYYLGPRMGLAKRWGKETLAGGGLDNRQFNDFVPPSDPLAQFFADAGHDLDATGPEGRIGFGWRARRAQPRLPEHRPLQRRVAAALPAADRRPGDLADQDRRRAEELGVLAGHRAADAEHGALLPRRAPTRIYLKDAPGGASYLTEDAEVAAARQGHFRRALRPLPLEQAAAAAAGPRPGELQRQGLPRLLGQLLGVDQDRRLQGADAGHRRSPTTS